MLLKWAFQFLISSNNDWTITKEWSIISTSLLSYNSRKYNSIKLYVYSFSWNKAFLYCFRLSHFSKRRNIYSIYRSILTPNWLSIYLSAFSLTFSQLFVYMYSICILSKNGYGRFRFLYNSLRMLHEKHPLCTFNLFNSDETYIFTLVNYLLISSF